MLAVSIVFGVLASKIHAFRNRERVIADIRAHRAHIFYEHDLDGSSEPPGPAVIRRVLGGNFFGTITYLSLYDYDQPITDEVLETVAHFRALEHLTLDDTEINDDQLLYISGLTELKHLRLQRTRITDAGLEHLHGLKNLKSVYLNETKVTEEGIRRLQRALPNAEILWQGFYIQGGII